ncbi:hypothetical protein CPB86DRAFT_698603, partial [Serendipita vermifera]
AETIDISAAIGLGVTALVLGFLIVAGFIFFWRKLPGAPKSRRRRDKAAVDARASTIVHSVVFGVVIACMTTWTSVALTAGGVVGLEFLRNIVNLLVFISWWTLVGSVFFLLAFLHDRSHREADGTYTGRRFANLYAHLIWLVFTLVFWVLGACLSAASVAQMNSSNGGCQLHCSQLIAIPIFAFIELIAIAVALSIVIISYWNARRRSQSAKRLGRSQSQSKAKRPTPRVKTSA